MTKLEELIQAANQAIAYGDSVDIFNCLVQVKNGLSDLQNKLDTVIAPKHANFSTKYYTATDSSQPRDYFDAALAGKSMEYELRRIGILNNVRGES